MQPGVLASGAATPSGPAPAQLGALWWIMLALGTAVFALFLYLLVRALIRRDRGEATPRSARGWLLGGGFALPTVVILVVFGFTVAEMRRLPYGPAENGVPIEVIGHQWWWEVHYPEHGFRTANEIHIPVGREVELRLRSADVIHSFWVPPLGGKLDLLPETTNTMVLEADQPGVFRGVCAEFCGLQHAKMGLVVVAEPGPRFEDWLERQRSPAPEPATEQAAAGLEVFLDSGCAECHTIRGTAARGGAGPDLTHVAGRLTLAAGTFPNTPDHMADWVTNPQSLKEGVAMPDLALEPERLEALLAYLESLE